MSALLPPEAYGLPPIRVARCERGHTLSEAAWQDWMGCACATGGHSLYVCTAVVDGRVCCAPGVSPEFGPECADEPVRRRAARSRG